MRRVSVECSAISKHVRNREQTWRRWLAERQSISSYISYCSVRVCVCACVCFHVPAVCIYVTWCVCCIIFGNQLIVSNSTRLMRQTVTLPENTLNPTLIHTAASPAKTQDESKRTHFLQCSKSQVLVKIILSVKSKLFY